MAQVRWSLKATADVIAIEEWIASDSPSLAAELSERLLRRTADLARFPRLGRVVPEFRDSSLRELILPPFRVVYLLQRSHVTILRVVHGSQDLAAMRRRDPKGFRS